MAQQLERAEAALDFREPIPKKPPVRASFVPEPLLDTFEAAAIMKIHPKTLQSWHGLGAFRVFMSANFGGSGPL